MDDQDYDPLYGEFTDEETDEWWAAAMAFCADSQPEEEEC